MVTNIEFHEGEVVFNLTNDTVDTIEEYLGDDKYLLSTGDTVNADDLELCMDELE